MALYEHVFIARQDVSSAQVDGMVETFTGLIEQHGGRIAKSEYWGLRTMAYRINKNRKGHYVLMNLDAPTAAVQELERNQRLHEDVLRSLTLRVDELDEGPSIVMQGRRDRDGGRRDRDRDRDRDRGPRSDGPPRGEAPPRAAAAPAAEAPAEKKEAE